jgi:hypothetical protein
VQNAFLETNARIEGSAAAIEPNAKRQTGSVEVIVSLKASAASIGGIGLTVAPAPARKCHRQPGSECA